MAITLTIEPGDVVSTWRGNKLLRAIVLDTLPHTLLFEDGSQEYSLLGEEWNFVPAPGKGFTR